MGNVMLKSFVLFHTMILFSCGRQNNSEVANQQDSEIVEDSVEFVMPVAVDLGLPSGTLWAQSNLFASTPTEPGKCFYWGEVEPYEFGQRYKYVSDGYYERGGTAQYLKYVTESEYGDVDNLTVLEDSDDAASFYSGGEWKMPSAADLDELLKYCSIETFDDENLRGARLTGPNGNSMFIPWVGGYQPIVKELLDNIDSRYWSTAQSKDDSVKRGDYSINEDNFAYAMSIGYTSEGIIVECESDYRATPGFIRPVKRK